MKHFNTTKDAKPLEALGLSKLEALIYLSALDLGQGTLSDIARNAGIERSGIYYHIENLINNSLLQTFERGKRTYYQPADPKILTKLLEHKKTLLDNIFPKIDSQFSRISSQSISEFYYGIDRAKQYYDRVYQLLGEMRPPNNLVYVLGNSFKRIYRHHEFFTDFSPPEQQIDIRMECVLPKSDMVKPPETNQSDPYIVTRFNLPRAELKFIPDKYAFYAAVAIINNYVCLFDYRNFSYTILENANVAKSWTAFFTFIWDHLPANR